MRKNPLDPKTAAEQVFNKLELERLKSPKPQPAPATSNSANMHINHVGANQHVFEKISDRLKTFNPQILLGEHIVHDWNRVVELSKQRFLPVIAHRNTLDGIDFIVEDRQKLLSAVRSAKAGSKPGFAEGTRNSWSKHWALALSFLATDGIGFREIFRPVVVERPLENDKNLAFDSRLGNDITVDVSSLHLAVSEFPSLNQTRCNIHIDNLTVTLSGMGDNVGISPTVIGHFVNELLFKTKLKGKLPDWVLDAFDIGLLNPVEGFLNAGVTATIINKPNFKWTIKYSVGLNNSTQVEWSGGFKFEKSLGTGITILF